MTPSKKTATIFPHSTLIPVNLHKLRAKGNIMAIQIELHSQFKVLTKNWVYGAEHYSRHQLLGHLILSQHFMDPEGSLPHSQRALHLSLS
jgi:hypothetical protein